MERPKGITALAVLQVVVAISILVMLVPGLARQGNWLVFGNVVGARTFASFCVLQALALLFFAWAFWKGLQSGFYLYCGAKPIGWIGMVLNGVTALTVVLLVVDVGILGYVVKNRSWFRN